MIIVQHLLVAVIRGYRWGMGPLKAALFGPLGRCRYSPTCSAYALEAVETHGVWQGTCLAARRLLRCHPWGGWGHDPVPGRQELPGPLATAADKDTHALACGFTTKG